MGVFDGLGGAPGLRRRAEFGLRYQYLSGGVNTGRGWTLWEGGGFVRRYAEESAANGLLPIFTYYMIVHSSPGSPQGEKGITVNLQTTATMRAYFNDLKLFFQQAASARGPVVLHLEPDLWGFMQLSSSGDAAKAPVQVAATGITELAGLPDNMAGFAQAIVRLRDAAAPNVLLAYHLSAWGTGEDFVYSNAPAGQVDGLGLRAAAYYLTLRADFDLVFSEFSDRDAGSKTVSGDRGAWWDAGDFARHLTFIRSFVETAQKRVVLWQIPFGNTKMRAVNNTRGHYQDNKVETLFDDPELASLKAYVAAGVIAFLFGRGADGMTCPCDAMLDGVTNPAPINGNSRPSLSADDDGGFFWLKAREYYDAGPLSLSVGPR